MRFELTADQRDLRSATEDLLAAACPLSYVRAAAATGNPPERKVWEALLELGLLDITVPAPDGGLGLDECALAPVLEVTGWCALPYPVVETTMVALPLGVTGLVASGFGRLVAWGADADRLVLKVGGGLRLYERDEVSVDVQSTVDGARRLARVTPAVPGALLTDDQGQIADVFQRAALGTASQLVGLSRRMLELTVAYVTQREQFGAPVGSFQAVQHALANVLVKIEFARPAVLRAAYTLAVSAPTAHRDVSMAKVLAGDAASATARAALQCHGAMGYSWEYDLQLLMKRAWALSRAWGDRRHHLDVVARSTATNTREDA